MRAELPLRVAYVVKRYPRFSETFIVNEILAHEAAGTVVDIFSLYPSNDTHFQDAISRVRAPLTCLAAEGLRAADLWDTIAGVATEVPGVWTGLPLARGSAARAVYQAALLAREVRRRGITHLHAHFATVSAEVAHLAAAWSLVPYTVTAHAKDIFHESVAPERLRTVLGAARDVITVSDFNVEYLTRTIGLPAERVHRIYNGLDLQRFACAPTEARPRRIVSVGRFVPKKGLDDLVRACALLRDRGVPFECVLVGSGPEEVPLREMIDRANLTSRFQLPGPLPQRDVIDLVRSASVFAAPCVVADDGDRDGLPTVLLEAMALGTPVVSTDVVGIPEIVHDGSTGLLVAERAPEALANALQRVLESPGLQQSLGRQARTLIEREFDVERNAHAQRALFGASQRPQLARAS